jgi:Stage II sporulation protein E (SpoIIE)
MVSVRLVPGRPIVQGTSAKDEPEETRLQQAVDERTATGVPSWWLSRGWMLPYLLIAAVVVSDLLLPRSLSTGEFLVLAPLLAGRVTTGRDQVFAAGLIALLVGFVLGRYPHEIQTSQMVLRLILIALGTMFALLNQGAYRRERSAFGRAADTITLAAALAAGLETEQAYELLVRSARTLYEAAAVAVYRRQGDAMVSVAQDREPLVAPLPARLDAGSFPAAFSGRPERVGGRSRSGPDGPMLEARGLGSLFWLPLIDAAGRQTGVILLAWRQRGPRLSASDLETSTRFASLGARAISGSERVQAQAEVLHQIQALLLETPSPWTAGYQVGVRYQSASTLAEIGGDFYDVVEVGEAGADGLAFLIADARGKGLEASSLAAVLKGAFRTLAGEGASPAGILVRLDRLVEREGGEEDFVTALAGRVFPNGRVVLASAGHPLPLGIGPPLHPRIAAPLGLGTRPDDAFGLLRPGQRLICYTDGLIEARNAQGQFVDPAALDRAMAASTLDEVLDELVATVERHSDGRHTDDLALLGLEYAPRR